MDSVWVVNISMEPSPLFPNPVTCIREIVPMAATEFRERVPWGNWEEWVKETWEWLELTVHFDPMMIICAVLICGVLTAVRAMLDKRLFTPLALKYKLNKEGVEKFPESIWKFMVYFVTWTWSAYITHDRNILFDIPSHWNQWYPGHLVDSYIYWLFTFEIGFYLHYTYGMIFLETRRKDFVVLLLHHVLTITLILGCYSVRYDIVGVLLIFIHDIGDVFLEGSKCFVYFKEQNGKLVKWVAICANVGFLLFSAEYFLFRIYWFVTKALYSTLYVCVLVFPGGPFYLPFNIMLLALLAMQIYWFAMILKLLVKVLILREELSDIRDIEDENSGEGETTRQNKGNKTSTKKPNGTVSSSDDKKRQ